MVEKRRTCKKKVANMRSVNLQEDERISNEIYKYPSIFDKKDPGKHSMFSSSCY